jgi:hypothetical protein
VADLGRLRDRLEREVRQLDDQYATALDAADDADAQHALEVAAIEDSIAALSAMDVAASQQERKQSAASMGSRSHLSYAEGSPARVRLDALIAATSPEVDAAVQRKAENIIHHNNAVRMTEYKTLEADLMRALERQHELHQAILQRRLLLDGADAVAL